MELDQGGYLSQKRYRVTLNEELIRLYEEALEQNKSTVWGLLADRGREFPLIVEQVGEVKINDASGADVATLIKNSALKGGV